MTFVIWLLSLSLLLADLSARAHDVTVAGRPPKITPDYAGILLPPNIAPLNFAVNEPGVRFRVEISSTSGKALRIESRDGKIVIPGSSWRHLLAANRGQNLYVATQAQNSSGKWTQFQCITNSVSTDEIDPYLAYRRLHPLFSYYGSGTVGIFQRNLESYDESPILEVKDRTEHRGYCVNCHTFLNRDPGTFTLHLRGTDGKAMLMARNGRVDKIDLLGGYMAWHPSGRLLAFSRNKLSLFFHSIGETREVYDGHSDLAIYHADSNTLTTPDVIAQPDRQENWPMWSPDGQYLYFASAPALPLDQYKSVRYDLMRVRYDLTTDTWGKPETLLSGQDAGHSLVQPRPSPDGRFLVFTACDYGHFPIYQTNSTQYLMELSTRQYQRMELNSGRGDTWHCWSSNSRWLVFSSKRLGRLLTRPFFSHIDVSGHASKPFVLPQEDPLFYDSFPKTYNVPEFITGPVTVKERDLFKAVFNSCTIKPTSGTQTPVSEQSDESAPARMR